MPTSSPTVVSTVNDSVTALSTFLISVATGFGLVILLHMRGWLGVMGTAVSTKAQQFSSLAATGEEVKMTLVVRKDLKMGTGKIAAQCAHAAVAVVEEVLALRPTSGSDATENAPSVPPPLWVQWYNAWHVTGMKKVALQCPDEAALMLVASKARSAGVPYYVIRDAGRTQIAAGSKTVVAVGPAPKSLVDKVSGDLKLL